MSYLSNLRGFLPISMLDWPGKTCAVLFTGGCNFRCPYCHNPELVQAGNAEDILAWDDFRDHLRQRTGWIDGVSITGGEPTLHNDLHLLCERIRDLEMMVKLDTNGSHPHMLRELLSRGLLDFVAMDVKTSPENYHRAVGRQLDVSIIEESIDIILGSGIEHEFRCTVVPGLVNLADLEWIARRIAGSRGLILQRFSSGKTLDPAYSDKKGYTDEVLREWASILSQWLPTTVRGLISKL